MAQNELTKTAKNVPGLPRAALKTSLTSSHNPIQCSQVFEQAKFYKKTGEKRALFQQKNGQKTGEIKKCHGKKRALSGFFIPIVVTLQGYFKHFKHL